MTRSTNPFLLLLGLSLLPACGDTLNCEEGTQNDYDQSYEICYQDAQDDACSGAEKGASYDTSHFYFCSNGLPDQGTDGCMNGYDDGWEAACEVDSTN